MSMSSIDIPSRPLSVSRTHYSPHYSGPSLDQPLGGRNVLVAHDSPDITSALAHTFAAAGARVTQANEADDARMLIAWGGYNLVFLDAAMPDANNILDLIANSAPNLLARTIALIGDLPDDKALSLKLHYPTMLFCQSWLVELVDLAHQALARGLPRRTA